MCSWNAGLSVLNQENARQTKMSWSPYYLHIPGSSELLRDRVTFLLIEGPPPCKGGGVKHSVAEWVMIRAAGV